MATPRVTEVGKLWKDPEIRWTGGGKAVCSVYLVFTDRKKDDDGKWVDTATLWVTGTVWEDQAEHVANSLSKGDQVLVSGKLSERKYEDKDGNQRTSLEMRIFDIGPVIKWAPVKVQRVDRQNADTKPVDDPWASADADSAPF